MLRWLTTHKRDTHPLIQQFATVELPTAQTVIDDCPLLAIDLELTGLQPERDHIVSIGWVPIRQREIVLTDARHYLIQPPVSVGQSATIHGLHDRDLDNAPTLDSVLQELLAHYAGYVLVAHNAALDIAFLRAAITRVFGSAPALMAIDTLRIEKRHLTRRDQTFKEDGLRLNACLHRHKLPLASSHNALEDAYSCALLLLAQIARKNQRRVVLGDLLASGLLEKFTRWLQ